MNTRTTVVLRSISNCPKSLADYMQTPALLNGMRPTHLQKVLDDLQADGLIRLQEGKFRITQEGQAELRAIDGDKGDVATPRTFVSPPTERWMPPKWIVARPNAEDHKEFRSRGIG